MIKIISNDLKDYIYDNNIQINDKYDFVNNCFTIYIINNYIQYYGDSRIDGYPIFEVISNNIIIKDTLINSFNILNIKINSIDLISVLKDNISSYKSSKIFLREIRKLKYNKLFHE